MTELPIAIDADGTGSPYEQVRDQVLAHVAAGTLAPGDRLPTVRSLAGRLGVAPGTVARAYRELESRGAVVTRSRAGTVVAPSAVAADVGLRTSAERFVAGARESGTPDEQILRAVLAALEAEAVAGSEDAP
ncbi:GntR family transcriptional regulator [Cellulomonas sp. PhB143]|uniref:GntR family transcriptional regulator n=1 Tax=Cellulomonas sp. PhB143 TaxID=2485186 RepID=UPI000FA0CA1F|nr:GntR family transcriptional regulator [Cellulomonas sp. PhB143]ROS76759.1 GntR family transcriptional regulator [Cellulomonas sp. PhB143]